VAHQLVTSNTHVLFGSVFEQIGLGSFIYATSVLVLGFVVWWWPDYVVRTVLWLPAHLLYRSRVFGRENIPASGPVLFVCNHVSFIDAFIIFLSQPRRVRFLVWAPYTKLFGLSSLLRLARVIPIDSSAGPRAIVKSLRAASDALAKGDVVCIFAEGAITRTGFLLPFHRGFELILKHAPAPIVPVCLDHVWGSIFSYRGGRFLWKWPQTLPYPVTIAFGKPVPSTAKAFEVRHAIQKLSADCAIARTPKRRLVHQQFVRMACRHPFRSCLIDPIGDREFNYGKALAAAWIMSRLLRTKLGDDTMVGLWLPPSAGGAFANIALAFMGKTSVNLNYTASQEIVCSAIRQCGIRHVLTSRLFLAKMKLDPSEGVELVYLEDFRKQVSKMQQVASFLAIVALPAFAMERWILGISRHKHDDLATVIFSSGSTGDPKGVMLTHGNIAANVESMVQAIDPRPTDRLLGTLPFFHSMGYTVTIWVPLQVGASLIFHPDPRQSKEIGDLCRDYCCTIYLTTPTLLRFCYKRCGPEDFKSIRILVVGAEKMPPNVAVEFKEKFGVSVLEGYGCTELSPVAAVNVPDWEEADVRQIGNKPGTIGQPIPGVASRVVHPDSLEPLPPNQEGMLMFYGANVMKGYLGKPELTRGVFRDGWYITGDIGKVDDDGFVTITDRLARFSKIAGEMVPHQKIEDELQKLAETNERLFAVTSVADERRGERLVVLHTPLAGTTLHEVYARLGESGLPNLWIPDERDFIEIQEMPILGTGKLDLKRIKELAAERLSRPKATSRS
jgi:acyl-[acyl-carrier-protein]-phospholipid O-acyltransferase/long-chain-fatty-acid--[acyl-carrier-protein] ligase